jgi:hypothetical protein
VAEAALHGERGADGRLFADFHVRDHVVAVQDALDQQFDLAAGGLLAIDAGLHHLGVVEDHQVAGFQQGGEVAKAPVCRLRIRAIQQPRSAAFGRRVLGDQFGGQGEIEIADGECAHVLEGRTDPFQEKAELSHARNKGPIRASESPRQDGPGA